MALTLSSPAFKEGETIPQQFTCEGTDKSPELKWSDVPEGAKSFVMIMDDPDAPVGTWDHWVLFDIPGNKTDLPEEVSGGATLADGSRSGLNSYKKNGYRGPLSTPRRSSSLFLQALCLG